MRSSAYMYAAFAARCHHAAGNVDGVAANAVETASAADESSADRARVDADTNTHTADTRHICAQRHKISTETREDDCVERGIPLQAGRYNVCICD